MNIEINQSVEEYLKQKNVQNIYIEMDNRGGCCSGPVFVPVVKLGKPSYINMYDSFIKNQITVYFPKKMNNEQIKDISIKLRNILGFKSLIVNGILAYKKETWNKKEH